MSEETVEIALSEKQIASLINGGEITLDFEEKKIKIRQSYMKDLVADMFVRKNRVMNTVSNTFEY